MNDKTGFIFRSRLNTLPLDLKIKIGEVAYQKGMMAVSRKKRILELLKEYDIQFIEIGTGTNRFIIKYDGYVIKIALDNEGIADNCQEWAMSELLAPDVPQAHEISKGGHLLVASYAPAFTTYAEMYSYANTIRSILKKWSERYLLGDVGLSRINYANWGIYNGVPVCVDYAYIFPAGLDLFTCICGNKALTFTDTNYTTYKCTKCGKKYEDRDLRAKVSPTQRINLFKNTNGIKMLLPVEEHFVDNIYVKIDNNPDAPDIYEAAFAAAQLSMGNSFY